MRFTALLLLLSFLPPLQGFVSPVASRSVALVQLRASVAEPKAKPPPKEEKVTKEAQELLDVLEGRTGDYDLIMAQTAPAVRVAMPEEFGLPAGSLPTDRLAAALKAMGFQLVLDTNTAADLTIMEEGTELIHHLHAKAKDPNHMNGMPMFTSCCPGWMQMVEKQAPELAPYVSSCKSPHMMYGALVKEYAQEMLGVPAERIYLCSVMPCVRKRGESDHEAFVRPSGVRDVDNVITTKDLGVLCRKMGIDASELEGVEYDSPFQTDGLGSGAGQLFGATGGVMEAAVRTAYEVVTGQKMERLELDAVRGLDGVKEATLPLYTEDGKGLPGLDLKIAVVSGLGEAKKLVKKLEAGEVQYDFVEVMACPGGCIGGGGQPRGSKTALEERLKVIYDLDRSLPLRRSHDNPTVQAFYDKYLGEYGSEKAHELLHVEPVYGNVPKPQAP